MKPAQRPLHRHLLRVEGRPDDFAELIASGRQAGLPVGWLELAAPEPIPPRLETAAAAGALRAVAIGGRRSVAIKPMRGEPVLDDVLREHFRGCALVLVVGMSTAGEVVAPRLMSAAGGWTVEIEGGGFELDTATLLARLRRPRPWSD